MVQGLGFRMGRLWVLGSGFRTTFRGCIRTSSHSRVCDGTLLLPLQSLLNPKPRNGCVVLEASGVRVQGCSKDFPTGEQGLKE